MIVMSKLLILQNIKREGPGILEFVLSEENIDFDLVVLDEGERTPTLDGYAALVVLGGPDSANDDTVKMSSELALIKEALKADMPYLGICLGLQVLVKAAGGRVVKGDQKEIGFIAPDNQQYTVTLTDEGREDPLLASLPDELDVFQLHGETVELTPDMTTLATGKFCRNQIVKVGANAYGIQSHFELTPEMLALWADQDPDLMPIGKDKLSTDFEPIKRSYAHTGRTLMRNFLKISKLI